MNPFSKVLKQTQNKKALLARVLFTFKSGGYIVWIVLSYLTSALVLLSFYLFSLYFVWAECEYKKYITLHVIKGW